MFSIFSSLLTLYHVIAREISDDVAFLGTSLMGTYRIPAVFNREETRPSAGVPPLLSSAVYGHCVTYTRT